MSVFASPVALDPLIAEAKRRARWRRVLVAAALFAAAAAGIALAAWPANPGGGGAFVTQRPGSVERVTGNVSSATVALRRGIGAVGTSGGVTWAASGHGIWLTTNGGSWRPVPHDIATAGLWRGPAYVEIQFVDKRHGWITTDGGGVDRTTDGGRTWRRSIPGNCLDRCGGQGISFLDARNGFVLEGARQVNKLFRTSDGGRTWQLVFVGRGAANLWGPIRFVNASDGFAGGPGSVLIGVVNPGPIMTLYRTTDGGRTWSKYDVAGSNSFVQLPNGALPGSAGLMQNAPNVGHSLNLNPGTVWESGDGGAHWLGRPVPAGVGLPSYFSAPSRGAWVFSRSGTLYSTADGGAHWREISLGRFLQHGWMGPIAFTSSRVGWAIIPLRPWRQTLFRTTDGGQHWKAAGPLKPKAHKSA